MLPQHTLYHVDYRSDLVRTPDAERLPSLPRSCDLAPFHDLALC